MGAHEAPETSVGDRFRQLTDHDADHASPDGHLKGWDAAGLDPSEYSDDDYADQFEVITDGGTEPR